MLSSSQNYLICGDNANWLQEIPVDSIDLCYIDPPFFSGSHYEKIWGHTYEIASFEDHRAGSIKHYISWMETRLRLIHKVLKPSGSLFLHCDRHASHHLRILIEDIFGAEHFVNEIIWHYRTYQGKVQDRYPHKHDTIFWYAKNKRKPCFQLEYLSNYEKTVDYTRWKKYIVNENEIRGDHYPKTDSRFKGYLKRFTDQYQRKPTAEDIILRIEGYVVDDVWTDIQALDPKDTREKIGYPTQKPEALLRRILSAATEPGDTVLDCFLGGGTSAKVCANMGRRFVVGDVSPVAIKVSASRLNLYCPEISYTIKGLPKKKEDFLQMDGHDFAELICELKGWTPNSQKTKDQGIDGWYGSKKEGPMPVQIKNHKNPIGRPELQKFCGAIAGQRLQKGIFVAWRFSKEATEYIAQIRKDIKIEALSAEPIIQDLMISEVTEEKLHKLLTAATKNNDQLNIYDSSGR